MKFEINPIAITHSCYQEKFATPRQPGLVTAATGQIELLPPYNHPDAVDGLDNCSHIWLQFVFHECQKQGWKNKVRPPRLGGNEKMGVFATRTTHRPNALGLSVVKLDSIDKDSKGVILNVSGLDLIDGTPIVDIKPYIPYSDSLMDAQYAFAQQAPSEMPVFFSDKLDDFLIEKESFKDLIKQVLAQDPRPAFHQLDENRSYGAKLNKHNVMWQYRLKNREDEELIFIEVISIEPL